MSTEPPTAIKPPPPEVRHLVQRQRQLQALLHRQALDVQAVAKLEARLIDAQQATTDELRGIEVRLEVLRREGGDGNEAT